MKFGFIAHPTSRELKHHVKLVDLVSSLSLDLHRGSDANAWRRKNLVPFLDLGTITSATSATCEGVIHYLPLTAAEILTNTERSVERVLEAIDGLRQEGAELIGLGGATSIIGGHGTLIERHAGVPVTSGNSLTAWAASEAFVELLRSLDVAPEAARIAVIGYPGSVALVLARLLLERGCALDLVHRRGASASAALLEYLPRETHGRVRLVADVAHCYDETLFFAGVSSTGRLIDPTRLRPGAVVVDVALPRDVIDGGQDRDDILLVDGGYVSASPAVRIGGQLMGLAPTQRLNGCIAETIVLSLEKRAESFSVGRELAVARVREIGEASVRHGLGARPLTTYGERIDPARLAALRGYHHASGDARHGDGDAARPAEAVRRFRRYINPVMADFLTLHRIDRVFVKGQGCTLTDASGAAYLDFVAGYGCLNLGHNHPAPVGALERFLTTAAPTFVQYISIPAHTAALAEQLCGIAPGPLERVFFSNSGAEAVEAALKLARAATGRSRILYAENSYHGKTLGALSVTGHEAHRRPFHPLVPGFGEIPFGDTAALARELRQGDVAGFIVEPIQGEGGVRVPPAGYLAEVEALCRRAGALLIVDEIQTGLGRTGRMFACEWEGVHPDILCVAKSLSGGLVPIGATLSRADVWDAAYGSVGRFSLHSSTFGGGNLAAAVARAAIDALIAEDVCANARRVGEFLRNELEAVASEYPFIREVRGKGLMLGIEFANPFDGGVRATMRELAERLPGNWVATYRLLPDEARDHLDAAAGLIEGFLEDVFCLRVVSKLGGDHRILTFLTANHARVLRIQPPLVLTRAEATRFVEGVRTVCADLATVL